MMRDIPNIPARFLAISLLLIAGCSGDITTSSNTSLTYRWIDILASLNSPVPFAELDTAELHGYLQVVNHRLADSLLRGPETGISLAAFLDDDLGHVRGEEVTANDVQLRRINSKELGFFGHAYERDIPAGSAVHWNARMTRDITFADSLEVPRYPEILNIAQYDRLNASQGIQVRIASPIGEGALYVKLRYDDLRNRAAGGDTANVYLMEPRPPLVAELSAPDNAVVDIPASLLAPLPKNRVYVLTVMRYIYQARPNSNGERMGMLAVASYEVPVMVRE